MGKYTLVDYCEPTIGAVSQGGGLHSFTSHSLNPAKLFGQTMEGYANTQAWKDDWAAVGFNDYNSDGHPTSGDDVTLVSDTDFGKVLTSNPFAGTGDFVEITPAQVVWMRQIVKMPDFFLDLTHDGSETQAGMVSLTGAYEENFSYAAEFCFRTNSGGWTLFEGFSAVTAVHRFLKASTRAAVAGKLIYIGYRAERLNATTYHFTIYLKVGSGAVEKVFDSDLTWANGGSAPLFQWMYPCQVWYRTDENAGLAGAPELATKLCLWEQMPSEWDAGYADLP